MRSKIIIYILFLVIGFHTGGSEVWAQNPFEIQGRLKSATKVSTDGSTADTTALAVDAEPFLKNGNPFEISHIPLKKTVKIAKRTTNADPNKKVNLLKPKVSKTFLFIILFFTWALFGITISSRTNVMGSIFKASINENILKLLSKEERGGVNLHFIMQYVVFLLNLSIFIYLALGHFKQQSGILLWFYCLLGVIGLYMIRHISMFFLGAIFPVEKEASLYNFTIVIFNLILGFTLNLSNLVLAFGPENLFVPTFYITLGVIAILYVLRVLRGVVISLNYIFDSFFIFFIYLCALEIIPMLVLIKFLSQF